MKRTLLAVCIAAAMLMSACSSGENSTGKAGTEPTDTTNTGGHLVSASSGPNTPEPKPLDKTENVTIAVAAKGIEAYSQALLAKEFGEFDKENLNVTIEMLPLPTIVGLLQSGEVAISPLGGNIPVLNAIAGGSNLAIVGAMPTFPPAPDSLAGFWVKNDLVDKAGKLDPCAMKGATVSFGGPAGYGSAATLPFANYIAKCNLTLSDVTVSVVGGPDALVALKSGSIDAAYLPDPLWADPKANGYATFAIPFGQDTVGGYVMGPLREKRPEVAEALLRALVRTTRTYLQGDYRHDPVVRPALEKVLGVVGALLDVGAPLIFQPDMIFDPVLLEPIQNVWIKAGNLLSYKVPLPATKIVDNRDLQSVLAG